MRWLSDNVLAKLQSGLATATPYGADNETVEDLHLQGQLVGGRFQIDVWLGSGGMGTVYRALDRTTGQRSVVKVIHPSLVSQSEPGAALAVLKEAVALGRVNERLPSTPHVVRLIDTGTLKGARSGDELDLPWIAIEYVDGGADGTTLAERIENTIRETGYALSPGRAARAVACLCEGLTAVHEVGVVHRDIKPANVLCTGSGEHEIFKLADFGIARPEGVAATFGGLVVGTPGYAPLELVTLSQPAIGPWTDVFGLAAVFYYMLTGDAYFPVRSVRDGMRLIRDPSRRTLLEVATLSPELRRDRTACAAIDNVLRAATAARPQDRTQSAKDLGAALLPLLLGYAVPPPPTSSVNSSRDTERLDAPASMPSWSWVVRQEPIDQRIDHVAWDGATRCFAATPGGVMLWDGLEWQHAPLPGCAELPPIRFTHKIGPGRWLVGGDGATFAVCTEQGVVEVVRGADASVHFDLFSGDLDDLAVVVGSRSGSSPALYALVGRHWLKPYAVRDAADIRGLARVDRTHWLLAGADRTGRPYAGVYSPLDWDVQRLAAGGTAPLTSCSGDSARAIGYAVSADGHAVFIQGTDTKTEPVSPPEPLSAALLDAAGRAWAAGNGRIWLRDPGGTYVPVFSDRTHPAPILSLQVDGELILAVSRDGRVIEGRRED